ncbi:hypothetical protein [Tessaracoccus palaemonis]|uniref:Uncharacterized protein n=1 Tax=Tessaracoccus palaemonis TaxID=2829499 RepID=A0ABX8SH81_9ACTN|nr:hypothetical protein [Tessaracoccus palaemonis]QXT62736.1 hypothetical protein KDB89_13535 [Tessaracoccus palaemonis]
MTTTSDPALLAAEYLDLRDRIAELKTRQDQLAAQLRNLGAGRHTAGNLTVTLTPAKRFNPDQARTILAANPDLLAACSDTVISATKAKAVLPPAIYEACSVEAGDLRLAVR